MRVIVNYHDFVASWGNNMRFDDFGVEVGRMAHMAL